MSSVGRCTSLLECWLPFKPLCLSITRSGVNVPGIRMVDVNEGLLGIEWIDGEAVKDVLPSGTRDNPSDAWPESVGGGDHNPLNKFGISLGREVQTTCRLLPKRFT